MPQEADVTTATSVASEGCIAASYNLRIVLACPEKVFSRSDRMPFSPATLISVRFRTIRALSVDFHKFDKLIFNMQFNQKFFISPKCATQSKRVFTPKDHLMLSNNALLRSFISFSSLSLSPFSFIPLSCSLLSRSFPLLSSLSLSPSLIKRIGSCFPEICLISICSNMFSMHFMLQFFGGLN